MHFFKIPSGGNVQDAVQSIPVNRHQLYIQAVKEHILALIGFSITCSVIFLPSEIWTFFNILLLKRAAETSAALPDSWQLHYVLVLFPCILVSGPLVAGICRVSRNWARGELRDFKHVFFSAIHDCWQQITLLTAITALLPFLGICAIQYFQSYSNVLIMQFSRVGYFILDIIWFLLLPSAEVMAVTYKLPFTGLLGNALYMTYHHLGKVLVVRLLSFLPEIVALLFAFSYPGAIAPILAVWFAFYIFLGYGLRFLLLSSLGNWLCENYLNVKIPGAKVNIGLNSEFQVEKK